VCVCVCVCVYVFSYNPKIQHISVIILLTLIVASYIRFRYVVLNIQNYLTYSFQYFVLGSFSIINIHQTVSLFGSVSVCIRVKALYSKPVTPVGAVSLESVHRYK